MSAFSHPSDLDRVPRLRLVFGERRIVGPGRADLLEGIAATGSIAGAGRRMGMSYKRAWTLVEELNATFDAPLVAMSRGGSGHGGAALTELGAEVLERYRRMQALSDAAIAQHLEALARRLGPVTDEADMAERK
ncbi:LysR family transcriptional regulator [Aureimonas sp. Leaf324]|uniref:winged helix-turn-helix domain-containing protein n=1 Tax=Aureimonas sp. Leaf324 TaxID=1736336 RepID=UPI0006F5DE39|nr:LysR family transcriptional regulator [Aureimonas sp. Leaf324]KQQ85878.1 ModE family transcriptional regulator [Aureimonas sp. Leaf324]